MKNAKLKTLSLVALTATFAACLSRKFDFVPSSTNTKSSSDARPPFVQGPILTQIAQLQAPVETETVLRLKDARIVYADYPLLQHDFPHLREENLLVQFPDLAMLPRQEKQSAIEEKIDQWIIANVGYVSETQAIQTSVNTPIETLGKPSLAYRPPGYGRALVFSSQLHKQEHSEGTTAAMQSYNAAALIDVKGVGASPATPPYLGSHSNGLLPLGEAIRELLYQQLIERLFAQSDSNYWTVPHYGVVDLGFDIKFAEGVKEHAGAVLRRAHKRTQDGDDVYFGTSKYKMEKKVELFLRRFGLTSANIVWEFSQKNNGTLNVLRNGKPHVSDEIGAKVLPSILKMVGLSNTNQEVKLEMFNIQQAEGASLEKDYVQILDFGSFNVREKFDYGLMQYATDRPLSMGGVVQANNPEFIQPDPQASVPFELWGLTGSVEGYGNTAETNSIKQTKSPKKLDNPMIFGTGLGNDFRAGKLSKTAVRQKMTKYINDGLRKNK